MGWGKAEIPAQGREPPQALRTLAKTSPFTPFRKGAPRYLCESHRYAGNNRWVLRPHARAMRTANSGFFRFGNGASPAMQGLGNEGAGVPTPLPQRQFQLRGRFRAHCAAYRFIAYLLVQPSRKAGRSWCCLVLLAAVRPPAIRSHFLHPFNTLNILRCARCRWFSSVLS